MNMEVRAALTRLVPKGHREEAETQKEGAQDAKDKIHLL